MVKRLLLLYLLLASGVAGATGLAIEWRSLNGELGKPLRGFLLYPGENPEDSGAGFPDLSSWQDDFYVELDYQESVDTPDGRSVTRQKVSDLSSCSWTISVTTNQLGRIV